MTINTTKGLYVLAFKGIRYSVFIDPQGLRQFLTKQQLAEIII